MSVSERIVLKKNDARNARRECDFAASLVRYLQENCANPSLMVPRPVSLIDLGDGDAVYVMQHMKGRELGSIVISRSRSARPAPLNEYHQALDFLAWFHAWAWTEGHGSVDHRPEALHRDARKISLSWQKAGAKASDCRLLNDLLRSLVPRRTVQLAKKDAHPENWLVGPKGQSILIDLESTALLPIYYEVCQLIDDYPLCPVDEGGIAMRRGLLEYYQTLLAKRVPGIESEIAQGDPWIVAVGYLLYRAAFGLPRMSQQFQARHGTSSSALRAIKERGIHYRQLVEWIARDAPSQETSTCAALISSMHDRLSL